MGSLRTRRFYCRGILSLNKRLERRRIFSILAGRKWKRKIVLVYAIYKYRGRICIASLILNLDTRWSWVVKFTNPQLSSGKNVLYPFNKELSGPQRRSGFWGRDLIKFMYSTCTLYIYIYICVCVNYSRMSTVSHTARNILINNER
jgi:hypothetical protein